MNEMHWKQLLGQCLCVPGLVPEPVMWWAEIQHSIYMKESDTPVEFFPSNSC